MVQANEPAKGMRPSARSLVRQLKNAGYAVREFELSSAGDYAVADADWNYKDVPHLNVVHTQVRSIVATMDEDHITGIALQKIFGIAVPVVLVNYADSTTSQTYYTTLGPYVLVVQTSYGAVEANRTTVTTRYHLAAKGVATLAFGLLQRIVEKNYATLMSEDVPMRSRRGELRERGYRFRTDGRPRGFAETTNLLFENLEVPPRAGTTQQSIDRSEVASEGDVRFVGLDDDRGLRLVRLGEELAAYPRVCRHEGAALDCSDVSNGRLSCPWHNKRIPPLLRVPFVTGGSAESNGYRICITERDVVVELPAFALCDSNSSASARDGRLFASA